METEPISNDAIRSEVEKICSSATMGSSVRSCRFLRYIVEETLAGRGEGLKEYSIGVEVFDRPSSYDPNIDSVVRTTAWRVRTKLREYFESEGIRDHVLINLRAGSYVPLFRLRESFSIDLKADAPSRQPDEPSLLIAILPFAALGGAPETDAFAEGLTEEITHRVSQVAGLRIVARRSAAQFRSSEYDLSIVREKLGADLVLDGTVRQDGSHLRISVELANAIEGHQLWSELLHCEIAEVFEIQEQIASSVVSAIRPRSSQFRRFALKPKEIDFTAFSLYLRGRQLWRQQTLESLSAAIGCFEEAIRKSPTYAPAHVGLADCHLALIHEGARAPKNGIPAAREAALRGIELDDELAEAITSLACIRLLYEWNWEEAESLFQRAIQLGGGSMAHQYYAALLEAVGRFEQGLEHLRHTVRLDPLAAQPRIATGLAFYRHREYGSAIPEFQAALELSGNTADAYCWLSLIYIRQEQIDQAITCIHKARTTGGANPRVLSSTGQAYALAGREAEAQQAMNDLGRLARTMYVSPVDRALLYLALGEKNAALDLLQQGYDERAFGMIWLGIDPRFDPIRNHPRFVELIEKMGFPKTSS